VFTKILKLFVAPFFKGGLLVTSILIGGFTSLYSQIATSASLILALLNEKESAFSYLSKQVDDPDRFVRIIAVKGLAFIGDKKSIDIIKQKTQDKDEKVKNKAAEIINELK